MTWSIGQRANQELRPPTVTAGRSFRAESRSTSSVDSCLIIVAILLLVVSSIEKVNLRLLSVNVYPVQAMVIALFFLLFAIPHGVRSVVGRTYIVAIASFVLLLPSLVLPESLSRLIFASQLVVNASTFAISLTIFSLLRPSQLKLAAVSAASLLLVLCAAQSILFPGWNTRDTFTLGIARPVMLFTEEGWVGIFFALFLVAFLLLESTWLSILCGFAVLISENRAAILIAAAGILFYSGLAGRRIVSIAILGVPLLLSCWFFYSGLTGKPWIVNDQTIQTRLSDLGAILRLNNFDLLPLGGADLSLFDSGRSRYIPRTSNVMLVDFVWKFGIFGLLVAFMWAAFFWGTFRSIVLRHSPTLARGAAVFYGVVFLSLQFNNAFGRSWFWVLSALLFAVAASKGVSAETQTKSSSLAGRS